MRVLVACEFSGRVRDAFLARGHDAVSCDLLPSESEAGAHYLGDVRLFLRSYEDQFDLMICHPPCRYLAVSGARWWKGREDKQAEALEFVRFLMQSRIPRIALENPVGCISSAIRKPDQYIQPWMFGAPESKKTGLWLKGLPPLEPLYPKPERVRESVYLEPPGPNRWKNRSRTPLGVAAAMADQWGAVRV